MKLIKLQVVNQNITNIDLLMQSVFGTNYPTEFVPNKMYHKGDKVYQIDADENLSIYSCTKDGVYSDLTSGGWSDFEIKASGSSSGKSDEEFDPERTYSAGDMVFVPDENGVFDIYQCINPGQYDTIDTINWKQINVSNLTEDEKARLQEFLDGIFGLGKSPELFDPSKEYTTGELVYIVDPYGHMVIYQCINPGIYSFIDEVNWKTYDTENIKNIVTNADLDYASDSDIEALFNVPYNYVRGVFLDTDQDGVPDMLWKSF